ncbi:hypothetical protein LXL04_003121 [Taraxacum kok-saghyz]
MAAEALIGAGVRDAVSKLSDAIIHVLKTTWQFRSELTQIQETITSNKLIFDEIDKLIEELDRPKEEKEKFAAQMKGAEALVLKFEQIKWRFWKKYHHALKLDDLNASLLRFCQIDLQLMMMRGVMDLLVAKDVQMRMMKGDAARWSSGAPLLKGVVIGFDERLTDLKAMVLKESAGGRIQKNRFTRTLSSLNGLSGLRWAYFDYNQFDSIPPDFFIGLDSLEV